jgi:hypothetical protein
MQNTKKDTLHVGVYIERTKDRKFYAGVDETTRKEIWNDSGTAIPYGHSSIYLAKLRPENYTLHYVTIETNEDKC